MFYKVGRNVFVSSRIRNFFDRTDYQDNHVNGQGNIGFCCSDCQILNGNITQGDLAQRSKFVQLDDRVKLPDASAVVFGDPEDKEDRKIPPS